jgi:hypothetical protein
MSSSSSSPKSPFLLFLTYLTAGFFFVIKSSSSLSPPNRPFLAIFCSTWGGLDSGILGITCGFGAYFIGSF